MFIPDLVAASATAVVWLSIGLVTTVAVVAMLVALVRQAILVGRAVGRFQDEATPILDEMDREGSSAARQARDLSGGGEEAGGHTRSTFRSLWR